MKKLNLLKMRLLLLSLLFISAVCFASNQTVYFEPKETTLTGVITMLTFPGPPNYENIKQGDKAEKGPYLILEKPVDIELAPNEKQVGNDTPTKNIQIIQLIVLNEKDWETIKKGNNVQITGTLSSPITGHHHARGLLEVKEVKLISKNNPVNQDSLPAEDKKLLKDQKI